MENKIIEYLEWKGTHSQKASIAYKPWLKKLVEICGDKAIEEYTISDIVYYQNKLKTKYSSYSLQYATIIIKNFFQFFRDQNYNCLPPSLIRRRRGYAKSHKAIKENEFEKIVSIIPENEFRHLRDLLIIRMLWDTGVRVSELCDMNISQIDTAIHKTVITTKKTLQKRIIIWSDETHRVLLRYIPIRAELYKHNKADALFVGQSKNKGWNSRLTTRSVERIVKYYTKRADIVEKITPHSFRHGWANKRRDQNAPLSFIQRGLGHLNPASTFVYEQYTDKDFEKNAKAYLEYAV